MISSFFRRFGLVLVWCAVIFFLSSQPHLPGPADQTWDFVIKKLGHITAYAILFGLTFRATRNVKQSFIFCVLYALSDEYHQSFVPGRTPMLRDVGIDIIGMCLACVFSVRYAIVRSEHGYQIVRRSVPSTH